MVVLEANLGQVEALVLLRSGAEADEELSSRFRRPFSATLGQTL